MRPAEIGQLIRAQISGQQGITCSVGVATTKFIAKLASVHCKPDGLLVIPADGVLDFLHPLPVAALWGVGQQTGQVLARLGLRTVADIAQTPVGSLERELGRAAAAHLSALAAGRDERKVVPGAREKSIGAEETFPADIGDPEVIRRELLRLSGRTARGLRAAGCSARTIVVKLRLASFKTITRSRTLPEPTDVAQQIYRTACELYAAAGLDDRARLRLVGVRANGLVPASAVMTQLAFGDRPVSVARGRAGRGQDRRAVRRRHRAPGDPGGRRPGPGRDRGPPTACPTPVSRPVTARGQPDPGSGFLAICR